MAALLFPVRGSAAGAINAAESSRRRRCRLGIVSTVSVRDRRYAAEVGLSSTERERVFDAVAAERRALAALVDSLGAEQLTTPSLCAGWDVKTVAVHLVSDFEDGFRGFLISGIRHGNMDRGSDALAHRRAEASAADIADALRRKADHRLRPPVTGPRAGLTDVLVHGVDIRIPLAVSHRPDPGHVAWVLDFLTGRT